jgi:predicted enzyme related to lactoylglutathione lyase
MTSKFTELIVDCEDHKLLGAFWKAVLDYKITEEDEESTYIEGPEGSGPGILFSQVPEGKTVKNRLHIDVSPAGTDRDSEVERVLGLGATKIDIGQGEQTWVVLADPEGNEFCILQGSAP